MPARDRVALPTRIRTRRQSVCRGGERGGGSAPHDQFIDRIEELDEPVKLVDPKTTVLVRDTSPSYRDSRLFLEALLRQSVPPDARLTLGHRSAMDVVPYQLDPVRLALQQPRQRILIADAVGLGKTIECGILLTELLASRSDSLNTLPGGPVEREIVWHAPFTKCDREADYAAVWRKLNEKEPTSTEGNEGNEDEEH
ncbi:MAG: hypothetical protein HS113_28395 [Verrucomicrobiales bacterium]|nr:hypothetical protein [Verrucomicrobiales bacterium]